MHCYVSGGRTVHPRLSEIWTRTSFFGRVSDRGIVYTKGHFPGSDETYIYIHSIPDAASYTHTLTIGYRLNAFSFSAGTVRYRRSTAQDLRRPPMPRFRRQELLAADEKQEFAVGTRAAQVYVWHAHCARNPLRATCTVYTGSMPMAARRHVRGVLVLACPECWPGHKLDVAVVGQAQSSPCFHAVFFFSFFFLKLGSHVLFKQPTHSRLFSRQ